VLVLVLVWEVRVDAVAAQSQTTRRHELGLTVHPKPELPGLQKRREVARVDTPITQRASKTNESLDSRLHAGQQRHKVLLRVQAHGSRDVSSGHGSSVRMLQQISVAEGQSRGASRPLHAGAEALGGPAKELGIVLWICEGGEGGGGGVGRARQQRKYDILGKVDGDGRAVASRGEEARGEIRRRPVEEEGGWG